MQGGLPVEDNIVVVLQMAFNCVPDLQMLVSSVWKHCQVNAPAVGTLDVFCSWPVSSAPIDKLPQVVLVVLSHNLWDRHVNCDFLWDTKLIEPKIGVGSND
jgi:hypothetical protein